MKNIIIVGASRSGKTTLAKQLASELNISHYPFDAFVSTLEELYPDNGIKHEDDNTLMSKKLAPLLQTFMKHMNYEDMSYVIDLYNIYPIDLLPILDNNTVPIYLGYPHIHPHIKLQQIKEHARTKDWTNDVPDKEMLDIVKLFIKENKAMYKQCVELDIPFFDTGNDFQDQLEKALSFILKNCK